jgi:hypothetical protein
VQGGANSPESVVIAALKAIEANDANAYLDVVDPQFRSSSGNYFFFSQFLSAAMELFGLGGTLGKDASRVNFRDLTAQVIDTQGALTRVWVSGFVRSPAFATEQAFEDIVFVRQIGGRWFISAPTASEIDLASQATRQAEEAKAKFEEQQNKLLADAILEKGELVVIIEEGAFALRPGAQWIAVRELGLGISGYATDARFRVSPDRKRIAWAVNDGLHLCGTNLGVKDIDGRNDRLLVECSEEFVYPNWSLDGQRLVVTAAEGHSWERGAGEYVMILDVSTKGIDIVWKGNARDATFMPDGKRLLLSYQGAEEGVLAVYDPDTGDEKKLASLPDAPGDIVWAPDWKQLAFITGTRSAPGGPTPGELWVIDSDGSNLRSVADYAQSAIWSPDGSLLLFSCHSTLRVVRPDGTKLPGELQGPAHHHDVLPVWWIEGSTPSVKAQVELLEEGSKERTVSVNLTDQLYGLKLTLREFQVTKDRVRVNLVIENTGDLGKVFLQPTDITLYILNQTEAAGEPNLGDNPLPLKIVTDMPSVLPVGKSWDGWLETDKPAPPDAVGAIMVFNTFDFEMPYDQSGNTKVGWNSTQEEQEVWYQPLR